MSHVILNLRLVRISNIVLSNAVHLNPVKARRCWLSIPSLMLASHLCFPSLSVAQQVDRSVLVFDGSASSAGSNAQVELEAESPPVEDSAFTFDSIPASTKPFLPPSPPASMTADSDNASSFRRSSHNAIIPASPTIETEPIVHPLRQNSTSDRSVLATSTTEPSSESGTFTSQSPSDTRQPSDSGIQVENAFSSPPASSELRSNTAGTTSRNRFGEFGTHPSPEGSSRFAPIKSSPSVESNSSTNTPPTQPAIHRPLVASASSQESFQPAAPKNRFDTPPTSGRPSSRHSQFSQPQPPANRPLVPSAMTTSSPAPPAALQAKSSQPSPQSNSVFSLNESSRASGQPPAAPSNIGNPASSSSTRTSPQQLRSRQSSSYSNSSLRPEPGLNSRNLATSETDFNSSSSSRPMVPRQASSSSPSPFSTSTETGQSSLGGSRLAPQTNRLAQQPRTPRSPMQSLRGNSANDELSGNSNISGNANINQSRAIQRSSSGGQPSENLTNANQSSGKADRESINFAQQLLQNIQSTSADADGTPVRLQEMLLEPLTGSQRKQMVAQYWETYYDLAVLKISTDYQRWLNSISTSGAEQGLLTAARRTAADQQLAATIQLGKSQSRLMDFMPNPRPSQFKPLPADNPLIEHYVTDIEKYQRVRRLPSSLRGIDPILASTLKLITQRAATVSVAKDAADQANGNRQIPLASTIAAGQLWRDSQLDMVASTVSYNQAISDFVLTMEPNRSPEQLTAFMLGTPKNNSQSNLTSPQNQPTRSANQLGYPPARQQFR